MLKSAQYRELTFSATWLVAVETHLTKQLHEKKIDEHPNVCTEP